ncbi:hypothetical protein [uncultured Metabacillus sp.]|uniref:hypothetical protein n=1 Tax=uncultured Metabacillus sp. TaxID=2860135 RepID=UPI002615F3A0|nr:hypothetical protein [uncultured Metabacillus sp.]
MKNTNRPKFNIGDIVVIIMYGTVGTITKLHKVDQHFVYEVNHSDILFFENALQLFSDYDGTVIETEQIRIEILYQIGDIVIVKGYGSTLFRIVGIRTEVWRYADDGWEELTYELTRISDGAWLEATEDEMSLMVGNQEAESFIQQLHLNNTIGEKGPFSVMMINQHKKGEKEASKELQKRNKLIDELLDIYNDYKALYELFNDPEYKEMMDYILKRLRNY